MEDVKIKISVLWISYYSATFLFRSIYMLTSPATIPIMSGEIRGVQRELLTPIILLVPLAMAFLSLTLKDSANRWANIILGIVFASLGLLFLIEALQYPSGYVILTEISAALAAALIVWYAYKWPKQED